MWFSVCSYVFVSIKWGFLERFTRSAVIWESQEPCDLSDDIVFGEEEVENEVRDIII